MTVVVQKYVENPNFACAINGFFSTNALCIKQEFPAQTVEKTGKEKLYTEFLSTVLQPVENL